MKNHFITAALCGFAFVGGFSFALSGMIVKREKVEPSVKTASQDSLKAVVADLEAKVEILNKYLVQKHLEYIDACDLKTAPK